jgi:hypothetical protein
MPGPSRCLATPAICLLFFFQLARGGAFYISILTLDLDIYIPEEWNYELLDTLASFLDLEHLTLRFEAQIDDWDDWDEEGYALYSSNSGYNDNGGYRGNENALMLMIGLKEYLRKQKVGKPLKVLETWVGSELMKDITEIC